MGREISNSDDVIDSRDVIARIEELESEREALVETLGEAETDFADAEENGSDYEDLEAAVSDARSALDDWEADYGAELNALKKLADEAESSPDWAHGETLIRDSYFVEYTERLVDDCYDLPKEMNSSDWPWRHMKIDWEAAADDLKSDYFDVDFDGVTYWIRA